LNDLDIWFISDHHFWHQNIIGYTSRDNDFSSVTEMNKYLIKEHNSVVKKNDWVYMLGDFCLNNKEECKKLVSQLRGNLFLVLGNHDRHPMAWYYDCGFKKVYDAPIIFDKWFILSHQPIEYISPSMPYVNIHGHTHDESFEGKQRINVSVERNKYRPISYRGIKVFLGIAID